MKGKTIYLISICEGSLKRDIYGFHFIGFYKGKKIKKVHLRSNIKFNKNEEYLLEIRALKISNNILKARLIRYKEVFI